MLERYIGAERQIGSGSNGLQLPKGEPLSPGETLRRRSDEEDIETFFRAGDPSDRPLSDGETTALETILNDYIRKGNFNHVPFSFVPDEEESIYSDEPIH